MAKIIINAKLSKEKKEIESGIALSIRGRRDIGLIDVRKIQYKDQNLFYCGIKWNEDKKLLTLVDEDKNSNANIGIFVSTYPTELVDGKILVSEYIDVGTDISSVCFKQQIGGYEDESQIVERISKGLVAINPKNVSLYLTVGTAKENLILKNSEGFYFVCNFKKNNWFTLKKGSTDLELYDYYNNVEQLDIIKDKLPFPGLDRKMYDEAIDIVEQGEFDVKKHAYKYV